MPARFVSRGLPSRLAGQTLAQPLKRAERVERFSDQPIDFARSSKIVGPFHSHPSHLPHNPSRSSHGNAGHDGDCVGRRRRFRLAANVAAGPERFRPRVPLPPLRAVRAGRAHSRRGQGPKKAKCIEGGAERTGTEIAGRAAARSRLFSLIGVRTAARLPDLVPRKGKRSVL